MSHSMNEEMRLLMFSVNIASFKQEKINKECTSGFLIYITVCSEM